MNGQVVLFLPSVESGGVERNAVYFANGMVRNGFDVHLLYCRGQETWLSRLDARVHRLQLRRPRYLPPLHERLNDALTMALFAIPALLRLRRRGPTVMVGFQSNVIAIGLGMVCRIPVAVRLSNHFAAVRHERSALRRLSEWMKRITYRHADRVIANSEELARDYAAVLHTEVLTVPNPVDFARIRQLVSEPVEEALFAGRQRPLVITAGRLAAQKNYPMLLRAMAEVVAELPCDLVILGEGEERGRLERLVGELGLNGFVHLPGYRGNVYAHFHRADLFVLSSNYEGMPNVLIEAIACGLPAVATRCKTGPTEILCDGQGGELVPVGDHHALARAMLRALRDPAAAQARHAVAAAHIRNYDLATIEAQYRQLVTAILPQAAKN